MERTNTRKNEPKTARKPYQRPTVHTEDATERRGLETCQPVPDAEQGCVPNA